ncbi:hypothetical protein LX15_003388 [Streptoalloteichus tenebrarius]|uniref:Uncharacterized protein n=1 Tax=Streptoalloteichus tenebrarius (strain ATCC 17920 / DSM 40477 / JCM 4838 / CBS 697.72 / NBRC 16177 / NCIMB 11028 / NRRL B-12390 / A12253. 1 / ISP 5477) TaxID=1933 RepID=A0ABT1HVX3_STRSD|nr:hypothetical protein [Streptoalloteichus tenebrarius]MCP2259682.1 hypothetical protein [Streptoalloteichus tenebrarius]BFF00659.1 hypothetical protein GCM10020241_23340 [Streptoalloteichus tenebrarius]
MVDPEAGWYFCLKHHKVERGLECRAMDRMGPYPDAATAEQALAIARQRTERADAADRDWSDEN